MSALTGGWQIVDSSGRRLEDAIATAHEAPLDSPELRRLAEARIALDRARRKAKWIRKCKDLQSAAYAVQVASVAAHNAGIGWVQIGDVLGIDRAITLSSTQIGAPTTPHAPPPDAGPSPHQPDIVAANSRRYSEDTEWISNSGRLTVRD